MKKRIAVFNGYEVTVKYVSNKNTKLCGNYGMTYYDENTIYIATGMTKELLKRTLIHELTHYALFAYDMSADDAATGVGFATEEQLCTFVETAVPLIYEQALDMLAYFTCQHVFLGVHACMFHACMSFEKFCRVRPQKNRAVQPQWLLWTARQ